MIIHYSTLKMWRRQPKIAELDSKAKRVRTDRGLCARVRSAQMVLLRMVSHLARHVMSPTCAILMLQSKWFIRPTTVYSILRCWRYIRLYGYFRTLLPMISYLSCQSERNSSNLCFVWRHIIRDVRCITVNREKSFLLLVLKPNS